MPYSPAKMKYTTFDEQSFRRSVDKALQQVQSILGAAKNPRLAADEDHTYEDKYALAEFVTNSAIASVLHVLDRLGLDAEKLQTLLRWVNDDKKTVSLSFRVQDGCSFIKETQVDHVVSPTFQYKSTETTPGNDTTNTKEVTVMKKVKQYHWKVDIHYFIAAYPGTDSSSAIELQSRNTSSVIVTSAGMANDYIPKTTAAPIDQHTIHSPIEINITWLLMTLNREAGVCQFAIDRTMPSCRTPRRNEQVDSALEFQASLQRWANTVIGFFVNRLEKDILAKNNPLQHGDDVSEISLMQGTQQEDAIYKLVVPLMEHGSVLSDADTGALLEAHSLSVTQSLNDLSQVFPPRQLSKLATLSEAAILLLCRHLCHLINQYRNSIEYVEGMLRRQLILSIGKEVNSRDFDRFMKFHNQKLLASAYAPRPFTYAIRRQNCFPDGILSIEPRNNANEAMDSVETMVRHVSGANNHPIFVPLNSATSVEITGDRYLHGWIQHHFESEAAPEYQIVARTRQFSSFLLVVGNMAGQNKFSPKAAIVLQNTDEVLIPLLTEVLPTAKEFKDTVASLSPEQQAFAKAYRGMQLESSVFGICVVQLKPQLEKLLGLPDGALTKEIKLTEDLMSLFVDYQIPSDLFSFGGDATASMETKLEAVKGHVKAVIDVISAAKENQIMEEERKAEMREAKECFSSIKSTTSWEAASFGSSAHPADATSTKSSGLFGKKVSPYAAVGRRSRKSTTSWEAASFGSSAHPADATSTKSSGLFGKKVNLCAAVGRRSPQGFGAGSCLENGEFVGSDVPASVAVSSINPEEQEGRDTRANLKDVLITDTMESEVRKQQFGQEQKWKQEGRETRANLQDVLITDTVESEVRKQQFGQEQKWKQHGRETRANLKDVSVTETLETEVRKQQFGQEQKWKQEGRKTRSNLKDVNMAVPSFESDIREGKFREANISQHAQSPEEPIEIDDFTLVPKVLDAKVEKFDDNSSLKSTILKIGPVWERLRRDDLLSDLKLSRLSPHDVRSEKNKAFDLLDALSRSGTLSIECAELHVVVAVSHCFENDLMGTIIQDNINPIEKLERSALIVGSTIHDETTQILLQSSAHICRIKAIFPALLAEEE